MLKNTFLLVLATLLVSVANAQSYPLDPLTPAEITKAVGILKPTITGHVYFNIINLKEPPKKEVLAWSPGTPFRREAFVSFYDYAKPGMTEAIVDLNKNNVVSVKQIPDVIGMGLEADSLVAENIAQKDNAWIAALKRRGLDGKDVAHRTIFPGDLGLAPIGHREQIIIPHLKNNNIDLEGLLAYADLTTGKIIKIVDEPGRFGGKIDLNYFKEDEVKDTRKAPAPIRITQPEGGSLTIDGQALTWQNWRLRFGIDNREGLIIYNVRLVDNGRERSVMYKGSMPEMVVPYGAPSLLQAAYNFFDAGEYRLGQAIARPMTPGSDAPENAVYLPATLHNESGEPFQLKNAVAVYEEYGGTLWRHGTVSRRATNLAIKYYTQIENYDYGFTWRFKEDGTIDIDVELTGIVEVQGVHRISAMDQPDPNDHSYNGLPFGTLVRPHVEAINHQHFFVFRLDMDVDGQDGNGVMEMNSKAVPAGPQNPYGNAFVVEHTHFMTEQQAQRSVNMESSRCWHVMNNSVHNALGQHTGYMLMPGGQAVPFAAPGTVLRNKAGFLDHQFWVTQYNEEEEYPAGKYPASNKVVDGIKQWTAKNRAIDNNDVVCWYIAGITHIVRPEEWPVMPCHHLGFSLMPFGFFSENPTLGQANPEFIKTLRP
jgi:primary-amine oxidase